MYHQRTPAYFKTVSRWCLVFLSFTPLTLHASFIEATMGTAVVNDAIATYLNPAALTLLKNKQIIGLGSIAHLNSNFTGQSSSHIGLGTQSDHSSAQSNYYLPSMYIGIPIQNKIKVGFAVVSNMLNSDTDESSILRYIKSGNRIQNVDFIPAIGIELNKYLSIGAGFNYSHASYISNPVTGYPNLNIPDSQGHNETRANSYGGDAGVLIKPAASTLIGLNYRSAVSYPFSGRSEFKGATNITSNNYNFNFWTPARIAFTISHYIKPDLGVIGTVQRVQWSIFKNVIAHGVATQVGGRSMILPEAIAPYHYSDAWIFTVGGIKKVTPKWIIRIAGTYNQSPGNGHYQISNGDAIITGASMGYELSKNIIIDGSYSHTFTKNQTIDITSRNNMITGINKSVGNAVSLKVTVHS